VLQHKNWTLTTPQADRTSGSDMCPCSVGPDLRVARQRLGWTVEQVAAALRIRAAYLYALEDGRLGDVPGNTYAIAFTRAYARCLGLDADETVRRLRTEIQDLNRKTVLSFPMPVPESGVPAGAMVLLGVVLALFAYGGWYYVSGNVTRVAEPVATVPERLEALAGDALPHPTQQSPQVASIQPETPAAETQAAASAPPQAGFAPPQAAPGQAAAMQVPPYAAAASPAPPAPSATPAGPVAQAATVPPSQPSSSAPAPVVPASPAVPPAPDPGRIVLHARADTWLQVRERAGTVLLNRVLRGGETWSVPSDKPGLLLTTGNAGGLDLVLDGTSLPSLGATGAVRRDISLDPNALRTMRGITPASAPGPASTPRTFVQ
jgi:cytoskeleton protein RodZ